MQLKWALLLVHGWWAPTNWRSQYEARGGNYLFFNCLIDNDFTSYVAWTKLSKFQPITTSLFSFSENVLKHSYSNAEFKQFSEGNTPDPRFGGREGKRGEVCFCSPKISYNNAELTISSGGYRGVMQWRLWRLKPALKIVVIFRPCSRKIVVYL